MTSAMTKSKIKSVPRGRRTFGHNPVRPDQFGDILNFLLADEVKSHRQATLHLVKHRSGHGYPAGLADALQASCDINAIAVYGAIRFFDDFTQIHTDAKTHPALL